MNKNQESLRLDDVLIEFDDVCKMYQTSKGQVIHKPQISKP